MRRPLKRGSPHTSFTIQQGNAKINKSCAQEYLQSLEYLDSQSNKLSSLLPKLISSKDLFCRMAIDAFVIFLVEGLEDLD